MESTIDRVAPDFQWSFDLVKSHANPANRKLEIYGIASDESLDLEGEITKSIGLTDCITYLGKWGKLNDDHSRTLIGDITHAEIAKKGELVKKGFFTEQELPRDKWNEACVFIKGFLYPKVQKALEYWDILESGGRIGLSLQGKVLKRRVITKGGEPHLENSKCFVNMVAVTPQPINPEVIVKMGDLAKSLNPCGGCGGDCQNACASGGGECLKRVLRTAVIASAASDAQSAEMKKGLTEQEFEDLSKGRIDRRKDVSMADKDRAEDEYGDVEYADPVNKKYPLDAEHIDAARSYWGNPDNRAKYSEEDQKLIGERIERAAKKHGTNLEKSLTTGSEGIVEPGEGGGEKLRGQSIDGPAVSLTNEDEEAKKKRKANGGDLDELTKSLAEMSPESFPSSLRTIILSKMELNKGFRLGLKHHGTDEKDGHKVSVYSCHDPHLAADCVDSLLAENGGEVHKGDGYAHVRMRDGEKSKNFVFYRDPKHAQTQMDNILDKSLVQSGLFGESHKLQSERESSDDPGEHPHVGALKKIGASHFGSFEASPLYRSGPSREVTHYYTSDKPAEMVSELAKQARSHGYAVTNSHVSSTMGHASIGVHSPDGVRHTHVAFSTEHEGDAKKLVGLEKKVHEKRMAFDN